ncbi:MAG: divergent polysaccharide deacetylase family protein [Candidatus Aminicenantes bacterium]|nr:divergent polysaccharide deacetylase family protein [Candidatus Aminicenantes bacterium]
MKRRTRPLLWLFPLFAPVLVFLFVRVFGLRTAAEPENPPPAPDARPVAASIRPADKTMEPPGPKAAIIIDDIGYNLKAVETALRIGLPLTLAILPDADLAGEATRMAEAGGLEIMLHLPFESEEEKNGAKIFKGTISAGMGPAEIRAAVVRALDRVPGAAGVNNHAGSSATEKASLLKPVFEVLKERGLYFIDSRTTTGTVARMEAIRAGIPSASRHVFIDAEPGEGRVEARLRELFRLARANGRAVGICHPKRETLSALARHLILAETYGVRLVFASEIVD